MLRSMVKKTYFKFPEMNMNLSTSPHYEYKNHIVFPFERNFDFKTQQKWMSENWHTSFYFIAAYLMFIYFGQIYMKSRNKFQFNRAMLIWNCGLAAFSIFGAVRTIPEFVYLMYEHGFHFAVCIPGFPQINKVMGFWTWLFVLSKIPELIDTVFIVLRKQKLIFLHWYHHVVTALYCWYTYEEYTAMNRWFVVMNLTIHSFMYSYFALRALNVSIPRWLAMTITSSQIVQMFIGSYVCVYAYVMRMSGKECYVSETVSKISLLMYGSYFILFINFFVRSYFLSGKKSKNNKTPKKVN